MDWIWNHLPRLRKMLRRRGRSPEEADDVIQELFVRVMLYFLSVDSSPVANVALQQWDLHYGGKPFGSGLSRFLHDNPIFGIDAVATPVRIETRSGRIPTLLMTDWESYAALRSLDKPVDLIVLPYASHVVSMPSDVLASQQGDVDWVRFWLQGYEDGDAGKAEQYRRWERLCEMQGMQNPGRPRACVSTQAAQSRQ
jgi:Sigma-70 region 2